MVARLAPTRQGEAMNRAKLVPLIMVGFTALFALAPQASAFAGQSVDPSTLNPPPPPEFNPTCAATGFGTLCHLSFSDPPLVAAPSGIVCSGPSTFEVLISLTRSVEGRRYYDRNANLTQRHFRESLAGTFINPLTGATVNFIQDDTVIQTLAVPGDIDTGNTTVSGRQRLWVNKGGTVLIDAGRVIFAPDGSVIKEAGPHPFNAYFVFGDTTALQPLCDALQ
jgi:hypothetical protein